MAAEREETVWNLIASPPPLPARALAQGRWGPLAVWPDYLRNSSELSPELAADGEIAASSFLTDVDPVPGPQADAGGLFLLRKSLDENGSAAVATLPVDGQAEDDVGRQVGDRPWQAGSGHNDVSVGFLERRQVSLADA